ncbi:hypothetical protein BZL29_8527 [Mycobacterium kansasii]|uniref:Uncharacterized protein n=1 Tax=Mycobacterium kansasii TaxID=1768 RepID=A0A1V3W924_MYCKA|nr:hypothetical protein BZL29_8527 [Mycobacterium kansasii]
MLIAFARGGHCSDPGEEVQARLPMLAMPERGVAEVSRPKCGADVLVARTAE